MYNIFPYLGFLLRANKPLLRNRDEFHAYVQVTFVEHLKNLDKNDQRSLIDAFLVKQQEVTESFLIDSKFYGSMKTFTISFLFLQLQLNFFREAVFEKTRHKVAELNRYFMLLKFQPLLISKHLSLFIFFRSYQHIYQG